MKIQFFNTGIILTLASILLSCSKPETTPIPQADPYSAQQSSQPVEPAPTPPIASTVSVEEGLKLIEGMDCLTCHKTDSKLIGPSYQEVAAKYTEADIDRLAQKIIEGGKGNWGDIPMAPHNGLSKDNAKLMVKYILSLKK